MCRRGVSSVFGASWATGEPPGPRGARSQPAEMGVGAGGRVGGGPGVGQGGAPGGTRGCPGLVTSSA